MTRLLVTLDATELGEAQQAARTLLAHPLVTSGWPDDVALALVRHHEEPLREELARLLGYSLEVGRSWARLVRRPSRLSSSRPALTRTGRPFGRRTYATLCLVLAALEQLGPSALVSGLVEEVNRQSAGDASLGLDPSRPDHRDALVDAVLLLQQRGVLKLVDGVLEAWTGDGTADALFDIDLDAAGRVLIAWPSVLGPSGPTERDTLGPSGPTERGLPSPADLLVEHHPPTEEGRATAVRHRVHRRLVEDPVVAYADLDPDELAYVRQRRSRLTEQLHRLTGCVVEARAEGLALVDAELHPIGAAAFPGGGTVAWAALLLGELLVAAVADGAGDERPVDAGGVATAWGQVVQHYRTRFKREYREDPERLLVDALAVLASHGLLRPGPTGDLADGVVVQAALARYRPRVRQATGVQGSLL
ncbi:MAG: TIGR02678 family protein [Acidimicrobiales bacterium]